MAENHRLDGRTVVVLGASAEGGTGWRTAERFASEGAHVFVAARSLDGITRLADRIGGTPVQCDAASDSDVAELARQAVARNGGIDAAVYAAGISYRGSVLSSARGVLDKSFGVNLFGAFAFLRELGPHMARGGAFTLLSSMSSTHVFEGLAPYGIAKAGLNALACNAALEFSARGVRVNTIIPGLIETPMAKAYLAAGGEKIFREIPLKKAVQPEEIADLCLFLTLDAPSITGAAIPIDGGNHLTRAPRADELG